MTPYLKKAALFSAQIESLPTNDLGLVVVIPAYNEAELIQSLESLYHCDLPKCGVEVIVVINDGEATSEAIKANNKNAFAEAKKWAKEHSTPRLSFFMLYHTNLPKKHAGVGLARKIGMDEAIYRLTKVDRPQGVIVCYDADSSCEKNYLQVIENYFTQNPKTQGASIHYEHPVEGTSFSKETYDAIIDYELHLRYYIEAQRRAGCPFAFHTVGSSMAVRADAYQAQGGMNRKKAGEDFYFLHKFIPLGHFGEINSTKVIPSPRTSDRVPFGTGKSVKDILNNQAAYQTYAPQTFEDLKVFLQNIPDLYEIEKMKSLWKDYPKSVQQFLVAVDFEKKMEEIRNNISDQRQFEHRFYRWFNAFLLMKYVHYTRDHFYPNVEVGTAVQEFLKLKETKVMLLKLLRKNQSKT